MTTFAVQYLAWQHENATPNEVRRRLNQAFEQIPISLVLIGWDLPPALEEACAEVTLHRGARLFRWHPLLTGTSVSPPPEWLTIGLDGNPVGGHDEAPDFTFVCPNRPEVREAIARTLDRVISRGLYQGLFLDRIRFPSPAVDPSRKLACFCEACRHQAAQTDLDLEEVRYTIQSLLATPAGAMEFLGQLFAVQPAQEQTGLLKRYLDFREQGISGIVESAARQIAAQGLSTGLDCFSPRLTRMVGQDLTALDRTSEWIKVMTYPRVLGPAGIPFELRDLSDWLVARYGLGETQALKTLAQASGYPIPASRDDLIRKGLPSTTIASEIILGHKLGIRHQLAGIAMVEQKGIHDSTPAQIRADLEACHRPEAEGVVVSWDLWLVPPEYLRMIREIWIPEGKG